MIIKHHIKSFIQILNQSPITKTLIKHFKHTCTVHQGVTKQIENFGIIYWIVKMIMEHHIYVYKDNPIAV